MKKTTIAYLLAGASCYFIICGNSGGPAAISKHDCTGAETGLANPTGCYVTNGCHHASATSGINVSLELDSVGVPTTHYTGGMNYTVKITGTNNTSDSLPKFGFQMSSIKGSVAMTTPTMAGTWPSPYPTNVHYTPPSSSFVVGVVEHGGRLPATSGSGGNGTVYSETINWNAPVAGTGDVSIWAALNAVNAKSFISIADTGDLWNVNHVMINEWTTTGVTLLEPDKFNLNIFPNPISDYAAINYTLSENSDVEVVLYDISGRKVTEMLNEKQNAGQHHQILNLSQMNLKTGVYFLMMKTENKSDSRKIIIQ